MQVPWVQCLIQEDPTGHGATKPRTMTVEPRVSVAQTLKPANPRAHDPQQEKPLLWEASALQQRVASAPRN